LAALALVYYVPAFLLGFVIFGVGGLVYTVVSSLLYWLVPRWRRAAVGQRVIYGLFQFFVTYLRVSGLVRVDFRALDSLRGDGPLILAPNHPSLLDAVFVISRLPRVSCVMKAAILDNPVLGGGARLADYIRNDSAGTLVNGAVERLQKGELLLLFPEGTRTVTPPLNAELKGGFALIAQRAGVAVQIIHIRASSGFLGKHWPWYRLPELPLSYEARLGERLVPGESEPPRDFVERVRQAMLADGKSG
jgi:1-acyl-sn-glycerol-3-phosphate acyltransferase